MKYRIILVKKRGVALADCIFCKIAAREIPSNVIYEDGRLIAFRDINPQAPVHFLVIPKVHIPSIMDVEPSQAEIIGHLHLVIQKLAAKEGLQDGFRIVNNCGANGGQAVGHLHFHVLGGRQLGWPPG